MGELGKWHGWQVIMCTRGMIWGTCSVLCMRGVVCVCVCMCCLGLSAKSNVCDVRYSVLFSLCLECVMIVGHVWCCVYVYVCVCLCLCVWVHVCACVYVCVCTCVVLCVMCSMVYNLFIFSLYCGGSVCDVRYGVCCLQRCLSLTLSPQDHQHTERKGTCRALF